MNADPQTDSPTYGAIFTSLDHLSFDGLGGNDSLTLDSPPATFARPVRNGFGYRLGTDNETLRLLGAAPWTFANDPAITTPNLTLTLEAGATATFADIATHLAALNIAGTSNATLAAGSSRRLVVGGLTIDNTSSLDLNDNDLIVKYSGVSTLPAVQSLINSARAGGSWIGPGLTSTAAKNSAAHNTGLGAMEAADYESIYGNGASFAGEPITGSAVLVKYTYYGDTDFNGVVNFDDYSRIDSGFNNGRSGWLNGDFDGNGVINFDDYSLIDLAFNTQGAIL